MANRRNSTEADQVAAAPIVEDTAPETLTAPQEGQEAPQETPDGQTEDVISQAEFDALPPHIQAIITSAENLSQEYEAILLKKEASRTLMRAYKDMGELPAEVCEYYYPTQNRGPRKTAAEKAADLEAKAAKLRANAS